MSEESPRVGQSSDGYKGFKVYEEAYSRSDDYLKLDSFLIGLKPVSYTHLTLPTILRV